MSDPIDRAAEVVTRAMFGLTTPSMSREIAYYLHAADLLVTPARDAAVAAKALREVRRFAEDLTEQGDHHVPGCMGQADCAACVQHDLIALLGRIEREGGGDV